jgi:hypothetical protein
MQLSFDDSFAQTLAGWMVMKEHSVIGNQPD